MVFPGFDFHSACFDDPPVVLGSVVGRTVSVEATVFQLFLVLRHAPEQN